jgi:ATP-dependent Lon protease
VLNEDHFGLKDIKERILEFIAVGNLKGSVQVRSPSPQTVDCSLCVCVCVCVCVSCVVCRVCR